MAKAQYFFLDEKGTLVSVEIGMIGGRVPIGSIPERAVGVEIPDNKGGTQRIWFGEVLSCDEAIEQYGGNPEVAKYIKDEGLTHILRTRTGHFLPFDPESGDAVFDQPGGAKRWPRPSGGGDPHPGP